MGKVVHNHRLQRIAFAPAESFVVHLKESCEEKP